MGIRLTGFGIPDIGINEIEQGLFAKKALVLKTIWF
jgi:hypothetical protein